MSESIRAYVFDADGVLIPSWGFANYLQRVYPEIAAQTPEFFSGPFLRCIVGQTDLREILPPFLARWKWPHTLDDFLTCWFEAESKIDPTVAEFIREQRRAGIPCYLATNQEQYRARYMRTQMGLDALFDGIFASAHLGVGKPEQAFYAAVTQAIGVAPEQIMFWDDTPAHVEAAQAFGWQAQLYTGEELSR